MSAYRNGLLALTAAGLATASAAAGAQPSAHPGAAPRAQSVPPDADENLQWAASVVRLDMLRRQPGTAKLFGAAGGDPAMNGLYTHLAFFESADDGWRIFRLGDFLSYRLLAEAPGRLTLEIRESVMDERSGTIGARAGRMLVSWTAGRRGEPPATVNVARIR